MRFIILLVATLLFTLPAMNAEAGLLDFFKRKSEVKVEKSEQVAEPPVTEDSAIEERHTIRKPAPMVNRDVEDKELWSFLWDKMLVEYPPGYGFENMRFDYVDVTCDSGGDYVASHIFTYEGESFFIARIATRTNDGELHIGGAMLPYQLDVTDDHGLCYSKNKPRADVRLKLYSEDEPVIQEAGDLICSHGIVVDDQVCGASTIFWPLRIPDAGSVPLVMYR